eukprot:CAMPEP_0117440632 /NCGR_PEP_ID=MMETSP0759-20121206/3198_1 /TAXON_ID=63605 /ORGANISM="Percolomonas cosmopolitus, Strain WS" /LENGTH=695 /DNA_ID=CAMNT_0005232419 /DNA_START=92 /DNA_END=2179 /DNA_ORIENTATION=+
MYTGFGFGGLAHQNRHYNIHANFPPFNQDDEKFWDLQQLEYRCKRAPEDLAEYNRILDEKLADTIVWIDQQRKSFDIEMNNRVTRWEALKASRMEFEERKKENKLNITYSDPDSEWRMLLDGRDIFTVIFSFLSATELLGTVQNVCWDFLNIIQEYVPLSVEFSCSTLARFPMDAILSKFHVERLKITTTINAYYGFGGNSPGKLVEVCKTIMSKNDNLKCLCLARDGTHNSVNHTEYQNFLPTIQNYKCVASIEDLSLGFGVPDGIRKFTNLSSLAVSVHPHNTHINHFGQHNQLSAEANEGEQKRIEDLIDFISTHKKLRKLSIECLPPTSNNFAPMVEAIRSNHNITTLRMDIHKDSNIPDPNDHTRELVDFLISDTCSIESLELFNSTKPTHAYYHRMAANAYDEIVDIISDSYADLSPSIKKIVVDVSSVGSTVWNLLGKPNCEVQLNSEFVQGKTVSQYLACLDSSDIAVTSFTLNEFQLIMSSSKTAAEKLLGCNSPALKHLTVGIIRGKHVKSIKFFLSHLRTNTHLESLTLISNHVAVNDSVVLDEIANLLHDSLDSLRSLRINIAPKSPSDTHLRYYQRRKRVSHDVPFQEAGDSPPLVAIQDEIVSRLRKADCQVKELVLQGANNDFNHRIEKAIYARMYGETKSASIDLTMSQTSEVNEEVELVVKKRKRVDSNGHSKKRKIA